MLQFLLGFTLGNVVGMYLAQNYENYYYFAPCSGTNFCDACCPVILIPNIAKKLEEFKKDVEAKKKPPSDKS